MRSNQQTNKHNFGAYRNQNKSNYSTNPNLLFTTKQYRKPISNTNHNINTNLNTNPNLINNVNNNNNANGNMNMNNNMNINNNTNNINTNINYNKTKQRENQRNFEQRSQNKKQYKQIKQYNVQHDVYQLKTDTKPRYNNNNNNSNNNINRHQKKSNSQVQIKKYQYQQISYNNHHHNIQTHSNNHNHNNSNNNINTGYQNSNNNNTDPVHGILISVDIQDLIMPKHNANIQNGGLQAKGQELVKNQKNLGVYNIPARDRDNIQIKKVQKNNSNNNNVNINNNVSHNVSNNNIINNNNINNPKQQLQFTQFQCKQQITKIKRTSPPPRQRTKSKQQTRQKNQKSQPRQKQTNQNPNTSTLSQQKINIQPQPQPQELISKFLLTMDQINNAASCQTLLYLNTRQNYYRINPKYIEDCQPNFTWSMRAYVIEWIMQVAQQFALKRQTFHISVNLFDRFLGKQKNLPKSAFQAIGATCMFIASKVQEFQPKCSQDFAIATGRLITATKLKQNQRKICQVLQFSLNPPTLYRWANYLMLQWDTYCILNSNHPYFYQQKQKFFKQSSQQAYINYRVLIQLIDCSTMDIQTAQYNQKLLVCSFMYLYLLKQYKIYSAKQISSTFPDSSQYLFQEYNTFNQIFAPFLQMTIGILLQDLLPTIQYCAEYFILPPNVQMPAHAKRNQFLYENMELEEYQAFQTFDKNMMKVVMKRRKNRAL